MMKIMLLFRNVIVDNYRHTLILIMSFIFLHVIYILIKYTRISESIQTFNNSPSLEILQTQWRKLVYFSSYRLLSLQIEV
jgi:hypothetical protein